MYCWVNGQEVPCHYLARRELNFSQPFPAPAPPLPYRISVAVEEFIKRLGDTYEEYARQDLADTPYREAGKCPVLDRWQELGYPPLEDLAAREPAVLEGLVKDWLDLEALDQLIPGPEEGLAQFLVNTIDRVTVSNGRILIEGQAFFHPMLTTVSETASGPPS
jgi:hypothetical protein